MNFKPKEKEDLKENSFKKKVASAWSSIEILGICTAVFFILFMMSLIVLMQANDTEENLNKEKKDLTSQLDSYKYKNKKLQTEKNTWKKSFMNMNMGLMLS